MTDAADRGRYVDRAAGTRGPDGRNCRRPLPATTGGPDRAARAASVGFFRPVRFPHDHEHLVRSSQRVGSSRHVVKFLFVRSVVNE